MKRDAKSATTQAISIPKELEDAYNEIEYEQMKAFEEQVQTLTLPGDERDEGVGSDIRQRVADRARAQADQFGKSQTHGRTYEEALDMISQNRRAEMEVDAMIGNRHVELSDREAIIKDRQDAARAGRKSFAMGAGLKDGRLVRA